MSSVSYFRIMTFKLLFYLHVIYYSILDLIGIDPLRVSYMKIKKPRITFDSILDRVTYIYVPLSKKEKRYVIYKLVSFLMILVHRHTRPDNDQKEDKEIEGSILYDRVIRKAISHIQYVNRYGTEDLRDVRYWSVMAIIAILDLIGWNVVSVFKPINPDNPTNIILDRLYISRKTNEYDTSYLS